MLLLAGAPAAAATRGINHLVAIGLASRVAVIYYLAGAATFGMDGRRSLSLVPIDLWIIFVVMAATVGVGTWRIHRGPDTC